ncbi:MAG TPA: LptE family protein [Kiritimatiellia bacterium]|nr:LptE family protein [Kiritimatiellia bacterium]
MKIAFRLAVLLILVAQLTGCVGYRLGSMLPPDIKSVYVPTFVNKTDEPFIESDTTSAVIDELQKDGSLEVVATDGEADAILKVSIIGFKLSPLAFDHTRKTSASEYRLTLTASLVMLRRTTNEVLVENPRLQGEATFVVSGDLTSSKRRGLPLAAADLAHDIVEALVESWK